MKIKTIYTSLCLSFAFGSAALLPYQAFSAENTAQKAPFIIQEQGSFMAGGTVVHAKEKYNPLAPTPESQTLHGDHAYIYYQIPVDAKKYPMAFLHGAGQFSRTWETTPDGREGFQNIFLRKGYGVYLIDQPRRGNAGRSMLPETLETKPDEQFWFGQFRLGIYPNYYEGTQFAVGEENLDQFFRQITPITGSYDAEVISDAMAAMFEKIGPAVFVTHSQGGGIGWKTATKTKNIKAIVSYEPGSGFLFPKGEMPAPIKNSSFMGDFKAFKIPLEDFMAFTSMPIVIYYGDNIPKAPCDEPHKDYWRCAMQMANLWAETVNKHGGDVKVVYLPDIDIHGNTHFPFSDRNNEQIADLLGSWLTEKGF